MPPPHHTLTNAAATQVIGIVAEAIRTMDKNGVAIPSNEDDAPTMLYEASNSSTFVYLMETIMWLSGNEDYNSNEEIVIDKKENEQKLEIEKIE
ncbi:hypothetical protein CFP56_001278 [Quercus suber]|uniref:Uncharacterized protein n=1 Tax=Quercus suber TaxID=58331 RepID=A0AAW0IM74_QUESU